MELEYFINPKMEKQTVHLGKNQLRFKMKAVQELALNEGDILRVGIDKDEKPLRHLYVIKSVSADGFKVTIRNKSCMISFKGMYDKLQLQQSGNARYEVIEYEGNKGLKITLPKII